MCRSMKHPYHSQFDELCGRSRAHPRFCIANCIFSLDPIKNIQLNYQLIIFSKSKNYLKTIILTILRTQIISVLGDCSLCMYLHWPHGQVRQVITWYSICTDFTFEYIFSIWFFKNYFFVLKLTNLIINSLGFLSLLPSTHNWRGQRKCILFRIIKLNTCANV